MKTAIPLSLVALVIIAAGPAHAAPGDATYASVSAAIKKTFSHTPDGKPRSAAELSKLVNSELKRSYRSLGLMGAGGQFLVPSLEGQGLMAPFVPASFVNEAVGCAKQNTYLSAAMEAMGKVPSAYEKDWAKDPKRQVIVSATVYAKALDRLGKLIRKDIGVLEAIRNHYRKSWDADKEFQKAYFEVLSPARDKGNIFFRVKLASVDPGIADFIEFIRTQKVPPADGRWLLAANIAEATVGDFVVGNQDNGRAGGILAENRVGADKLDPKTQNGPTTLSPDKKAILYAPPLPKKWADLYQTWNMAFVSQSNSSAFLFTKLFTPQVSCYAKTPTEYIFNRAVALYLHLHFFMYQRVDAEFPQLAAKANRPAPLVLAWEDPALTKRWGAANLISAKSYAQDLECLTPGWFASAKATFASLADKTGEAHRAPAGTPEGGAVNEAALEATDIRTVDQKMKEWGNWLVAACKR